MKISIIRRHYNHLENRLKVALRKKDLTRAEKIQEEKLGILKFAVNHYNPHHLFTTLKGR